MKVASWKMAQFQMRNGEFISIRRENSIINFMLPLLQSRSFSFISRGELTLKISIHRCIRHGRSVDEKCPLFFILATLRPEWVDSILALRPSFPFITFHRNLAMATVRLLTHCVNGEFSTTHMSSYVANRELTNVSPSVTISARIRELCLNYSFPRFLEA